MIEVRDVTKRYKSKNALEKVSFSADDGQVTGFVGPNGAGKSTTIRIISGVEAPSSGVALVDDTPFASVKDPTNALGVYLGSEHLPSRLKGIQYIEYMCRLSGISIETARSILDDVGLADAANKRISSYSLGMKQRIGLAAALVGNPSNLVLDEPINGLDPFGVRWIRKVIRKQANAGVAVLLSSHLLSELELVADKVVMIDEGRVIEEKDVSNLVADDMLEVMVETDDDKAFLGVLAEKGVVAVPDQNGLVVLGMKPTDIAVLAVESGIGLERLFRRRKSLEDAFLAAASHGEESHDEK